MSLKAVCIASPGAAMLHCSCNRAPVGAAPTAATAKVAASDHSVEDACPAASVGELKQQLVAIIGSDKVDKLYNLMKLRWKQDSDSAGAGNLHADVANIIPEGNPEVMPVMYRILYQEEQAQGE
jgi:hypothetical protein